MSQKVIDGFGTIDVGPFAPLRGLQVRARVAKALVPALSKAGPLIEQLPVAADGTVNLADVEVEKLGPLIGHVLADLNPDELPELVKALLATTSVIVNKRKHDLCTPGEIDSVFLGHDNVLLLDVIPFALKELFAGFLSGIVSQNEPTTPAL
jgi:hypothetical protein